MIILLIGFFVDFLTAQTILDNAIIGQPYISCERDRIVVEVVTERSFTGKMFVKGDYTNPTCSRFYKNGHFVATTTNSRRDNDDNQPFVGTVTRSKAPLSSEQFPIAEGHIVADAEAEAKKKLNKTNNKWKSVGGVSAGLSGAFGGSRGEEKILKVFQRPGDDIDVTTKSNLGVMQNCLTTTCEPCVCDERRSRRATNSIRLEVPLDSCNSKRDRKLNPPSVVVSFVAIVSFHDSFITKLDKAYHIQCAYAEAEKIVSTDLDVGMIDDTELSVTTDAPTCDYLITDENGRVVKNGAVGGLMKHRWSCSGGMSAKLKVLVYDCFVKDGAGQQYQIIDEHGCSLDRVMLQTPTYSDDGLTAEVDAYIFKFPDRADLDFQCSITFCSIDDNECHTMTPPKCDGTPQLFRRKRRSVNVRNSLSLHSNSLTIFDISMDPKITDIPLPTPQSLLSIDEISSQSFCISIASFGILISASTFFATVSIAIIFSYIFIRFNQKLVLD